MHIRRHRPTNPGFMPAITKEVYTRARFFKPLSLALLAKAYSRIGWTSVELNREIARMAQNRLPEFRCGRGAWMHAMHMCMCMHAWRNHNAVHAL